MNEQPANLYQQGTLGSLMGGLYEGTMTIGEILTKGDFGIGTLDSIDGELIILDQKAYQARSDNQVIQLDKAQTVPYAAYTTFIPDATFPINESLTNEALLAFISQHLTSENTFHAIKLTGSFKRVHVRVIPRQERPYPAFTKAVSQQPDFLAENIRGTVVGFYTPELFHGASVAGYHLHFLSEDHQFGGHIMEIESDKGTLELQMMENLIQHFQVQDKEFLTASFDTDKIKAAIDLSE